MEVEYSKAAIKEIGSMNSEEKRRIRAGVNKIPEGDIKALKGCKGSYRLRVGERRIIFSYPEPGKVLVEKIGPRGDVYKGRK